MPPSRRARTVLPALLALAAAVLLAPPGAAAPARAAGAPPGSAAGAGAAPAAASPGAASPGAAPAAAAPAPVPLADWMGTVFAARPATPLSAMVIPGTHDSGAYRIDTTPPCRIQPVAGADPSAVTGASINACAVARLSRAQSRGLGRQLADGVRYLDLRVGVPANLALPAAKVPATLTAAQAARVPLYLHHTFASVRLTDALGEVLRFAAAHPREQVVLDFQHVDLTGDARVDAYYRRALDLVLRTYRVAGGTVCSRAWTRAAVPVADAALASVPVGRAWAARRSLLVLTAAGEVPADGCYRSRERALWSPWPNTEVPAVSAAANRSYLAARRDALAGRLPCAAAGGNRCGLFVNQVQLSFSSGAQFACVLGQRTTGCSLLALARLVDDAAVARLSAWRRTDGLPTNIAIVDFYETASPAYTATLVALNG